MVCCNLYVVRRTQSLECIAYTTFGLGLNPSKTLEIHDFLAVPACRATEMPAEALVSRAESYGFLKTLKSLGKNMVSPTVSRMLPKMTVTKQADVSLGLVGRNKVT